jgi:hypothetical protein
MNPHWYWVLCISDASCMLQQSTTPGNKGVVSSAAHGHVLSALQGLACGIEGVRMLNLVLKVSSDNLDKVPMVFSEVGRGEWVATKCDGRICILLLSQRVNRLLVLVLMLMLQASGSTMGSTHHGMSIVSVKATSDLYFLRFYGQSIKLCRTCSSAC